MKPLGKLRENVYMPAIYKAMPAKIELDGGLGPYRHWHTTFSNSSSLTVMFISRLKLNMEPLPKFTDWTFTLI